MVLAMSSLQLQILVGLWATPTLYMRRCSLALQLCFSKASLSVPPMQAHSGESFRTTRLPPCSLLRQPCVRSDARTERTKFSRNDTERRAHSNHCERYSWLARGVSRALYRCIKSFCPNTVRLEP